MKFKQARRIENLPPYLFARIEKLIEEKKQEGVDIISLGIGDPDMPTPENIVNELIKEAQNSANHQYSTSVGLLSYRQAVCTWYKNYFDVELNPETEVVTLLGSKEGIAHISWCYLNPGDTVIVTDPGYPVYAGGAILAGAEPYYIPLEEKNGFLPDLSVIPQDVAERAKMMFLNYPNNPTGAVADEAFFREVVDFAAKYNILVCHDAAYSLITYEGFKHPSFLNAPGAKDVGIEFGSLSKPYNMTGWRIGWAAGNEEVIEALGRLKSNIDSGVFQAVQYAGIEGLTGPQDNVEKMCKIYQERRDIVVDTLKKLGWNLTKPKASFYIWAPVPAGYTSASFAEFVLEKAGVVITPGTGYGKCGEGYFRISLTLDSDLLEEAMARIRENVGKVTF